MRKPALLLGLVVAVAASGTAMAGAGATYAKGTGGPIVIGASYPITGPDPSLGASAQGAQAAVKYINAHGGVLGRKLEIKVQDDTGNPSIAISNLRTFAHEGISVVVTNFSDDCDAESPVAAQLKLVAFCSGPNALPKDHTNMYAVGPGFGAVVAETVRLMNRFATNKKAAVLANNTASGNEAVALAEPLMRKDGITPIVERYSASLTSVQSEVQSAVSAGAQVIYDQDCDPAAITAVSQAQSLGFKGKFILDDCLSSAGVAQALKNIAGNRQVLDVGEYLLLSNPAPSAAERAAIKVFRKAVPGSPNTVVAAGWDSVLVAVKAIEKAKSTQASKLLATLNKHFHFTGVWQNATYTTKDHGGGNWNVTGQRGYVAPIYFTSSGTLALLP